jgi:putative phage-type endonuclease
MIILTDAQGTPEWMAARIGKPTASNFDKIVTMDGKPSKQRQKYMYQLAAERLTGQKEESFQSAAMQRGIEMEEEARSIYEILTGNTVEQVGLCHRDEKCLYGASPDGLVGEDGLVEIKCPTSAVHVSYLLNGELPSDYFHQVQGQLFITGRKWVDFFSYYPGIAPLIVRVEPDAKFAAALEKELNAFCEELDTITEKLRKA